MQKTGLSFRWRYIALPVIALLVSLALAGYYYGRLPVELAYNFKPGAADSLVGRDKLFVFTLVPQLAMVLLAAGIAAAATRLVTRLGSTGCTPVVDRAVSLMGNFVALPQLILSFAMLDIFVYNLNRIHLMPLWAFTLFVMLAGAVWLGVFLMQAMRQMKIKE